MPDLTPEAIESLMRTGAGRVAVHDVDGIKFAVLPQDYVIHDLAPYQFSVNGGSPVRTRAHPKFYDAASFCQYVGAFEQAETRIFAARKVSTVTAIIDYHRKQVPNWCDHRATLQLTASPEWNTWWAQSGKQTDQAAFARFLEDNAPDIIRPAAATMMEIAETINISSTAKFDSGIKRTSGQTRISFSEDIEGKAGKSGDLLIPDSFVIRVPIYQGMEPTEITARFRFRLVGGKLTLWFDLLRASQAVESAFRQIVEGIATATSRPVLNGEA